MRVPPALLLLASLAACGTMRAGEPHFTVITVDPLRERLQLFLNDEQGHPYKRLERVAAALDGRGQHLSFGMNAGMYHADYSPVGLFVADGVELSPLNLSPGKGNFFLRPNGVFLVSDAGAQVVESSAYPALAGKARLATQSGPMLLSNGVINPLFDPDSHSLHVRNGVCALDGKAVFVISEERVNFYQFARYFRDVLKCRDALYLDGSVSSLYSPALGRNDYRADLGPMIGVIAD
ncbi:phosphodiester glycosidase family protein [Pseudoduganella sp. S-14]|uniref:phosphodiester glycosidase family protein n=1 Tax=Pseudoduganella sp. S-14 TaxID=3404065 RepID=UPI003CF52E15